MIIIDYHSVCNVWWCNCAPERTRIQKGQRSIMTPIDSLFRTKQGPAGQRCVREAHEAHEAHLAYPAHLAHPAHPAHTAISMLDWPDDFHRDNSSFSAFEKKRVTDGPTDRPTDRRTDTPSYRDARTHLKMENPQSPEWLKKSN